MMDEDRSAHVFPPLLIKMSRIVDQDYANEMASKMRDGTARVLVVAKDATIYQLIDGRWEILPDSEPGLPPGTSVTTTSTFP